jgi:iron(III) transport system ATP-binding protein
MAESVVEIHHLCKSFGTIEAVRDMDLDVKNGEFMILLGPSGCGKTTLLRCIAGLEQPDSGEIYLSGQLVSSTEKGVFWPPYKRNLGMVFQSYALWPHMTVFENVAYPLTVKKHPKKEKAEKVREVLSLMGIEQYETTNVTKLSGGQQQRVALARSIVMHPKLILLDEPLSNLDAKFRKQMRFELKKIQRKVEVTFIFVTHNQDEAMGLGDRIAVIESGVIQQIGPPIDIYKNPRSPFVAEFVGRKTMIRGVVKEKREEMATLESEGGLSIQAFFSGDIHVGEKTEIIIAPASFEIYEQNPLLNNENVWPARVTNFQHLGDLAEVELEVLGHRMLAIMKPSLALRENQDIFTHVDPKEIYLLKSPSGSS